MARLLYLLLLANMFNSSFQGGCPTVRISGHSNYVQFTTYTMTRQLHDDRPVYRSSYRDYLIYDRTYSSWSVGDTVGSPLVALYVVDSSMYADSTSGTWYISNTYLPGHRPDSYITASCDDPYRRVNGQWSYWSSWSSCQWYCICGNSTCVLDTTTRRRQCITPPPRNGGSNCAGSSSSTRDCDCRDINECLDDTLNNCDLDNGSCVNTQGSFHCECDDGYNIQADGRTCQDIDECADNSTCVNGACTNSIGSYNCTCNSGYWKNATTRNCADIDECTDDNTCVRMNGRCTNAPGNYTCTCNSGYRMNPTTQKCEGLSIGAIVGISLGAAAAVLITAVVFYCCCCKKSGSVATAGHAWPVNETSP
ncbi:latent-transforming growth factor beta-binding protein 1-like [Branchiostoma lanceolatum]|uniref:latent-transforming growth factor beta-binding protein 1-like n=1 Tax=Branchiostoma lanceolatum TaxID=7740 RepID=UPI003451D67A